MWFEETEDDNCYLNNQYAFIEILDNFLLIPLIEDCLVMMKSFFKTMIHLVTEQIGLTLFFKKINDMAIEQSRSKSN